MKHAIGLLTLTLLLLVGNAHAVTVTQTITNVSVHNGVYTFEVWGSSSQNSSPYLFSANFYFYSTPGALSPGSVTLAPLFSTWLCNLSTINDSTISFYFGSGTTSYVFLPTSPVKIATISLTINKSNVRSNLRWDVNDSGWSICDPCGEHVAFAGSDNSPLPIQLASFEIGKITTSGVLLNWSTVSEINNFGFYVQRDGLNVAFIAGHGTSLESHSYSYTDNPSPGKYQYRLKQVDLDGTSTLSEALLMDVAAPAKFALNTNYPNPFNPATEIAFSITKEGPVSLRVYDVLGREVATLVNENRKPGQYTERFEGNRMASGVYMYVLRSSEGQLTSRMILSK